MRQPLQQNEGITLTKQDKIQLAKAVKQELAQKEDELKKQEEHKLKSKMKIFCRKNYNEKNSASRFWDIFK